MLEPDWVTHRNTHNLDDSHARHSQECSLPLHTSQLQVAHHTLDVAPRMRSSRVSSFLSWWWLPLPLLMISTPARARLMWGALAQQRHMYTAAALHFQEASGVQYADDNYS